MVFVSSEETLYTFGLGFTGQDGSNQQNQNATTPQADSDSRANDKEKYMSSLIKYSQHSKQVTFGSKRIISLITYNV